MQLIKIKQDYEKVNIVINGGAGAAAVSPPHSNETCLAQLLTIKPLRFPLSSPLPIFLSSSIPSVAPLGNGKTLTA
jgi:hypothetical protein